MKTIFEFTMSNYDDVSVAGFPIADDRQHGRRLAVVAKSLNKIR
jgi:hypothetical protein